jgi:hypothetical protein
MNQPNLSRAKADKNTCKYEYRERGRRASSGNQTAADDLGNPSTFNRDSRNFFN